MNFLFYILTLINILLFIFTAWAKGFRSSFGAGTDLNVLMMLGYGIVIITSCIVKFGLKQKGWAVLVAALPVIILFAMYLLDRKTGPRI